MIAERLELQSTRFIVGLYYPPQITMLKNVSSQFQKLKIQHQFLMLVLLSAIIPASVVGVLGTFSASGSLSANAEAALQEETEDQAEEMAAFLTSVRNDVMFMSQLPPVQGIIRARANGGTDPQDNASYEEWVAQMQTIFVTDMQAKSHYMQLRYLDEAGNELVRVDSDGVQTEVIPTSELQNKSDRGYFIEAMQVPAGSLYVSPVNLNQERGAIEEPYKPVIRYAVPVEDTAGQKRGMIIANVFAAEFIDNLATAQGQYQSQEILLVNQDGYYLYHPDATKLWGFDLGHDQTLASDFSLEISEQVLENDMGTIDVGDRILAYFRFAPNPEQPNALITLIQVPKGEIFASVHSFKVLAGLAVIVSLSVVMPLAIVRGRHLVKVMEKLALGISSSSQEMATTVVEQERIASQQAASVNETTATMEELEASSRHAAEQANAAVESAKRAFRASEAGTQAVDKSLEGMHTLEQKVEAIAEQIVTLSDQASQINSISQLMIDFATQTNMLALNSSVEAVRAGEHGRGFAVVSDEIRKLADQSQKSADKISTLVADIQKSINKTVMVTEEGTKTVKMGMEVAKQADESFGEVKEAVNRVVLNNQQISLNLAQQVDAITQVVDAMEIINRGAKETASGLNQTKAGTEQLNEAALGLKQIM